jgi:hypothetical protein
MRDEKALVKLSKSSRVPGTLDDEANVNVVRGYCIPFSFTNAVEVTMNS